jgi:hypothetical protein
LHNADRGKSDYRHEGKKFGSHKIFLFPAGITFWGCGSGKDEEPSGEKSSA